MRLAAYDDAKVDHESIHESYEYAKSYLAEEARINRGKSTFETTGKRIFFKARKKELEETPRS